jgi:hypothetical protein
MFEKLLKASDILSPSVTKLLRKAGLPLGNVLLKIIFLLKMYVGFCLFFFF